MNPLNTPVNELFYQLNTLNGLLFTLDNQLNNFDKLYRGAISKASFDISLIFSGTSLALRDLTEWPADGWAKYYPSGKFSSKGERYFELIRVFIAREAAWTVAQGYEAFEKYLKDISATLLLKNQNLAEIKKVYKYKSDVKSHAFSPNDISYWRTFLNHSYKNNAAILKFLRRSFPKISESETLNNRSIDLTDWFGVVEEIRHSVTHSNFIIKPNRMINWSKPRRAILRRYFPGNNEEEGYRLNLSSKDAEVNLLFFSEYAFQIYKIVSADRGYDWNILNRRKD